MTTRGAEFTDPTGRTVDPAPEKRFRGNVFALKLQNRRNGLEIGPDTPIPIWNGESMGYGMAVEGLLQLE